MDTVDEEVNTGETTRHERPPPPVIILSEVIKSFSQQNYGDNLRNVLTA